MVRQPRPQVAVKVYALLSFFDENPEHLRECVTSCAKVADHVVAVDGRYALYPDTRVRSPVSNANAIRGACAKAGLGLTLHTPNAPYAGGEVEKRAFMFRLAEGLTTPDDWYLIVDGDMLVHQVSDQARDILASANYPDTGEVLWQDIGPWGTPSNGHRFRSFFRALRGLTVRDTHWLYMCGNRYMWHVPSGDIATEPALDLIQHVTLHHRRHDRSEERDARQDAYYKAREENKAEIPPR